MHVRLSVGVWVGESSYLPDLLAWSRSPGSCKSNVTVETPLQACHFPCLIFKHTCYVPLNRTLVSFYFFCLPLSHSSVWHLDLLGALLALRCHFLMSPVLRAFTLVFLVSMLIPDEPHSVCDDSWVFLGRALIWVHCIPTNSEVNWGCLLTGFNQEEAWGCPHARKSGFSWKTRYLFKWSVKPPRCPLKFIAKQPLVLSGEKMPLLGC